MIDIKEAIIWENEDYIIINKPAGVASQSSKTHVPSVWNLLEAERDSKFHLSNRLDQPVSGCVVFSKHNESSSASPQGAIHKVYLAVVEKKDIPEKGTLLNFLKRDPKRSKSLCVDKKTEGYKKAVLHYTVIKELDNYIVLKIIIKTGRFHQIRAQLSHIGLHIKGDVKYGARRKNHDRSIHLHAREITLYAGQDNEQKITGEYPKDDALWVEVSKAF